MECWREGTATCKIIIPPLKPQYKAVVNGCLNGTIRKRGTCFLKSETFYNNISPLIKNGIGSKRV